MKFEFKCNAEKDVTLEVEGKVDYLIDSMALLGGSIRKLSNNIKLPISGLLLPIIMEASEINENDEKELYESAKVLLVEMQKDLKELCEQTEEEENEI